MARNRKESIAEAKKRFPAVSEKPKGPSRAPSEKDINMMRARKAHEDHAAAREIAELYDMPCDVGELL